MSAARRLDCHCCALMMPAKLDRLEARTQMLDDALDRAILAGCIAPFQSDQQLAATGDHLALQRAEPDLKRMEFLGVAGRRSVLLVLAHIDLTSLLGLRPGPF
jgi:hypothetical protein